MIPFIDLETQYKNIKKEVLLSIEEVLNSKKFIQGEYEKEFSKVFSQVHGASHTIGCANGTSAITVALRALGVKHGDEIITVANSFFATPEAIVEVGATPVFVDCYSNNYLINIEDIEKKITKKNKSDYSCSSLWKYL